MRDHSHHVEVSREQAVELLLSHANFSPAIEEVPVAEAIGRVLAEDATAQLDMPNCLTCRMDSVAVHWSDFENGMPDTTGWQRGREWQFANTGIGMPEGFDTAIVIEHVTLSDDLSSISFDALPSAQFAGTSAPGSRMRAGDVLVPAGTMLTPLLAAHAASGNNATLRVLAKPKVAFIPTGNELVPAGSELARAQNVETNSIVIGGKIRAWGGEVLIWDIVPDNQELIRQAIVDACEAADIVIINAGSSKGSDDWNVEMLDEVGTVLYHETNHGPGHHSSGSVVNGTPVIGISGPPGGAAFTTDFYVYPVMMHFLGQPIELQKTRVRLAQDFPKKKGKPELDKGAQAKTDARAKTAGEVRPSIVAEGSEFFGVKQLAVRQGADGMMEAVPASSGHAGAVEANDMNAYWLQSSLHPVPEAGELMEVELRPAD